MTTDEAASTGRIFLGLPAYNEELALPRLLDRVQDLISATRLPLQVVLYNDGCSDGTVPIAEARAATLPITIIGTAHNQGLGAGLRGLVGHAVAHGADDDVLVIMDCDDTHSPAQIPDMLAALRRGNDVVVASRFTSGAVVRGVPPLRRLTAFGAMTLFRVLHPVRGVRDYTCGFRAYRIGMLRAAVAHHGDALVSERGFACMVELLLKLARRGARFTEVPLSLRYDLKPTDSKMDVGGNTVRLLKLLVRWRVRGFGA